MELWTKADWHSGLCAQDQIGLTKDGPTDITDPLMAGQEILAHMGGLDAFKDWAAKNPNQVYPVLVKSGINVFSKVEAKPKDLSNLTDADMLALTVPQLTALLLRDMGITTREQLLSAITDSKKVADILECYPLRVRSA